MGLFAIGDLHLPSTKEKTMDMFGGNWTNHKEKLIENWSGIITDEDTALLAGDISWAMSEAEAVSDLSMISAWNGRKILLEGNHDYWWKSTSKLERQFPELSFLKNNHTQYEDWFICGCRGWTCPNEVQFTEQDEKLYKREQMRLRLSLDSAMRSGAKQIILMMHFPPMNEQHELSGFVEIFREYPIHHVVYGHLHHAEHHKKAFQGMLEGIEYHLISADYLDFTPKKIL
ncbi:metallophosphoesterase [Chakrabartyella piscis]|uniref:metallophosphoesterase n=1 Tax=Chakrabartyella piscis TaxID=2918914 RepID=UPI0029588E64|nr:metallophosphoesterase [Chakrabartyella piscis]